MNKKTIPAIDKMMLVLDFISQFKGASFTQIYKTLGLPKSTTSSLLAALVTHGLLQLNNNQYYLGIRLYGFGMQAEKMIDIKQLSYEPLLYLRNKTQLACHLGVQEGNSAIYLLKLENLSAISIKSWVGKKLSLHSSGLGKAILAWLPDNEVNLLYPDEDLPVYTPSTIKTKSELREALAMTRKKGWAFDNAEDSEGVYCVGAPVLNSHGKVIAAISAVGVAFQVNEQTIPDIVKYALEASNMISDNLSSAGF